MCACMKECINVEECHIRCKNFSFTYNKNSKFLKRNLKSAPAAAMTLSSN